MNFEKRILVVYDKQKIIEISKSYKGMSSVNQSFDR
jgi:hypothetical protein